MNTRKPYFSKYTKRIIESIIPDKFKLVQENSNGYKLINLMYGIEVDLLHNYLDEGKHANNLALFDYSTDNDIYEVVIKDNIMSNTVYGDGNNIKITDGTEFYDGNPTRIDYVGNLTISGISYGIVGLEYLRTAPEGSGILLMNLDIDASTASENNTYQTYKIKSDTLGNFDSGNPSGFNFPIREQSYDQIGIDEILVPELYYDLQQQYPMSLMIKAPRSGELNVGNETYYIDHYTPDNGYFWDSTISGYVAIGYNSDYYFDDTGTKTYYKTGFNNPYGTGVYDTTYIILAHTPVSGTMKVYDIDILDSGNIPMEILSTGKQSYFNSGVYNDKASAYYIGYASGVPHEYLPYEQTGWVPASDYKLTTWDYCRESGGLDDNFDWIEYPTNNLTNRIKIVNPISRYLVTYNYATHKRNKYISSTSSTKYLKTDNNNYLFTTLGNENNEVLLDSELSLDTRTDRKAITFKGMDIRPGSKIDRLEIEQDVSTLNNTFNQSNITLHLEKNNAGYTQTILPNRSANRIYYINSYLDHQSNEFTLINDYSEAYLCNYDVYFGTRLIYASGDLYYNYSGFINLETISTTNNRYLKLAFKQNSPINEELVLAQATNETGEYWSLSIDTDGFIKIHDQDTYLKSYYKIPQNMNPKEIIIERNMDFNTDKAPEEYNIFYKENNNPYKQLDYFKGYQENEIPSGNYTRFYINCSLDVKYAQIYEESREYTNV